MNIQHPISNIQHRMRRSWPTRPALALLAAGMVLGLTSVAQQANTNSANTAGSLDSVPNLSAFNIIERRNIFNPNRRPYFNQGSVTPRQRVEGFALKGTMSYSKGRFAFFDGTSSEYNKVLEVGGSIAGYTVAEITPDSVMLSAKGKEFRISVGKTLVNQGGSWQMSGRPVESLNEDTNSDETTAASADSSTPPAAANAQMSEVLQRLMKQREQELK